VIITAATEVPKADENALMAAIALTPISLSVDASGNGWQSYAGGVYSHKCTCTTDACLDHGVGGVGFDDQAWCKCGGAPAPPLGVMRQRYLRDALGPAAVSASARAAGPSAAPR
jgi:hypothetical protein